MPGRCLEPRLEPRGMNEDYPVIDFWPMQRFGGQHVGFTLRAGNLDLHLAYAFIFQETLTVDGGRFGSPWRTAQRVPIQKILPCVRLRGSHQRWRL